MAPNPIAGAQGVDEVVAGRADADGHARMKVFKHLGRATAVHPLTEEKDAPIPVLGGEAVQTPD